MRLVPFPEAPASGSVPDSAAPVEVVAEGTGTRRRPDRSTIITSVLDPRAVTTPAGRWPLAVAALEAAAPFATVALRIGLTELLMEAARAMRDESAGPEFVVRAQAIIDALRHVPWDTRIAK